jgi:hypothetical protein
MVTTLTAQITPAQKLRLHNAPGLKEALEQRRDDAERLNGEDILRASIYTPRQSSSHVAGPLVSALFWQIHSVEFEEIDIEKPFKSHIDLMLHDLIGPCASSSRSKGK